MIISTTNFCNASKQIFVSRSICVFRVFSKTEVTVFVCKAWIKAPCHGLISTVTAESANELYETATL